MSSMMLKPLLWPTLISVPALIVLCLLGNWQLDRREWKASLIQNITDRTNLDPVRLPPAETWPELDLDEWNYKVVRLYGKFDHEAEIHVFAFLTKPRGLLGGSGYWVITPLHLVGGDVVLVNRGFVPVGMKDPVRRIQVLEDEIVEVTGFLRKSEIPGWFVPEPDLGANVWHARNISAMGKVRGLDKLSPFYVDQDVGREGEIPQGGETQLSFRNEHFGYALTWFGLAGALMVIYVAFHHAQGRIGSAYKN